MSIIIVGIAGKFKVNYMDFDSKFLSVKIVRVLNSDAFWPIRHR